jgi:hypothetical protein
VVYLGKLSNTPLQCDGVQRQSNVTGKRADVRGSLQQKDIRREHQSPKEVTESIELSSSLTQSHESLGISPCHALSILFALLPAYFAALSDLATAVPLLSGSTTVPESYIISLKQGSTSDDV